VGNINTEILEELVLYSPTNGKKRLGRNEDGGYVVVGGYEYDCFISVGIANEVSFEIDFYEENLDIPSFAIEAVSKRPSLLPDEIVFIKKRVGFDDNEKMTTLSEYIENYNDVFIKMDIEGAEWGWINAFGGSLKKVKQLTFEAHAMFPHTLSERLKNAHCQGLQPSEFQDNILSGLRLLNDTHNLVHVYENNSGPFIDIGGINYPSFPILTYLRKDCETNGLNRAGLPIEGVDFPCYPKKPNHEMNIWPFVFPKE